MGTHGTGWRGGIVLRGLAALGLVAAGWSAEGAGGQVVGEGRVIQCDSIGGSFQEKNVVFATQLFGFFAGEIKQAEVPCRDEPQKVEINASADFEKYRVISQAFLTVTRNVNHTYARSSALLVSGDFCFVDDGAPHPLKVYAVTRGSRQGGPDCLDDNGFDVAPGACSTTRAVIGSSFNGAGPFVDPRGGEVGETAFTDISANERYVQLVPMIPDLDGLGLSNVGSFHVLTRTKVEETTGTALASVRFFVEKRRSAALIACTVLRPESPPRLLSPPSPSWLIDEGDALPDDFSAKISPPSGPLTARQEFDLVVVTDTGGAAVVGVTGSLDGQDVSGPLAACLRPVGPLTGPVTGVVLSCPGLTGGLFGPGPHTLAVSVALSDGRTLSDSVTWTIRQ